MSALRDSSYGTHLVEVEEVNGGQQLKLPAEIRVQSKRLTIVQSGDDLILSPEYRRPTETEFNTSIAELQRLQLELGDLFPEGRQQPPMPVSSVVFPED